MIELQVERNFFEKYPDFQDFNLKIPRKKIIPFSDIGDVWSAAGYFIPNAHIINMETVVDILFIYTTVGNYSYTDLYVFPIPIHGGLYFPAQQFQGIEFINTLTQPVYVW